MGQVSQTTRQYYDELNLVQFGKHYGWPGGSYVPGDEETSWFPGESHIGPLWNFEAVPFGETYTWPVPTGIDILKGTWDKGVKDPLFLAFFNCPSLGVDDLGPIEMFTGMNYSDRTTLAWYIDGPIDLRVGHCKGKKLYFAEMSTGAIYNIAPAN